MLSLLLASAIVGLLVFGISGVWLFGAIAAGAVFVFGLPIALITGFIHGEVSYAKDRDDYREELAEMAADERALAKKQAEDARAEKLTDAVRSSKRSVVHDNRQVHINGVQL